MVMVKRVFSRFHELTLKRIACQGGRMLTFGNGWTLEAQHVLRDLLQSAPPISHLL